MEGLAAGWAGWAAGADVPPCWARRSACFSAAFSCCSCCSWAASFCGRARGGEGSSACTAAPRVEPRGPTLRPGWFHRRPAPGAWQAGPSVRERSDWSSQQVALCCRHGARDPADPRSGAGLPGPHAGPSSPPAPLMRSTFDPACLPRHLTRPAPRPACLPKGSFPALAPPAVQPHHQPPPEPPLRPCPAPSARAPAHRPAWRGGPAGRPQSAARHPAAGQEEGRWGAGR